mgnify:FL=1
MATFDEIQLQKLLAPFENNRGIVSTNNAIPMLNSIPMIDTFSRYQENQIPLVNQINESNESMTKLAIDEDGNIKTVANPNFNFKPYKSTEIYDPAFGNLVYRPGGMSYQLNDPRMIFPTYGGISGYREVGDGIDSTVVEDSMPSTGGITELDLSRFQGVSDLGRDDEDVEQVDYLPGGEPTGIKKLFNFIKNTFQKLPTPANLLSRFKSDPRAVGIRNFYRPYEGITNTGAVASGLMAGYNPVSGFGKNKKFGLSRAMQKRIERIEETLKKKDSQQLKDRVSQLRDLQRQRRKFKRDRKIYYNKKRNGFWKKRKRNIYYTFWRKRFPWR